MPVCEKRINVTLGPNEYVVLVNLSINGEEHGQVPIRYKVPEGTLEEKREFALDKLAEISKMLNEQGEQLVKDLPDAAVSWELRIGDDDNLEWMGQAPDTPEGLT